MGKQQLHSEFWWGNPLSKRALRERIRKWADNIKVNLRTLCCVDRRLITLVDDCVHIGNGSVDSTVVIRMTKKCRRCLGLSYTECLTPMRGSGKTEHTTEELRCLLVAKRRVKVASYWPSSHLAALWGQRFLVFLSPSRQMPGFSKATTAFFHHTPFRMNIFCQIERPLN